jgi:hypothetical protein
MEYLRSVLLPGQAPSLSWEDLPYRQFAWQPLTGLCILIVSSSTPPLTDREYEYMQVNN